MDIIICIERLGLNKRNEFILNQSNPPHSIVEWTGDDTQPTQAELETAWSSYQAEQGSTQYARDRAKAYPSIAYQLDDIYHNGVAGWKTSIKAVKDQYPKT